MVPALAFYFIIVATYCIIVEQACCVPFCGSSDHFFTQVPFFLFFVKNTKNENRLCPLPYEEALKAWIIKTIDGLDRTMPRVT